MNILCQICTSLIATANKEDLKIPLHGSMFQSPYPDRMPESLFPDTEWEFLRCPVCLHRPFLTDDIVMTDTGVHRIPPPEKAEELAKENSPTFVCPDCGKPFESGRALNMHKLGKARKGKKNRSKTDG